MRQIGLNYKREGEEIQGRTGQERRRILRSKVMRSWSTRPAVGAQMVSTIFTCSSNQTHSKTSDHFVPRHTCTACLALTSPIPTVQSTAGILNAQHQWRGAAWWAGGPRFRGGKWDLWRSVSVRMLQVTHGEACRRLAPPILATTALSETWPQVVTGKLKIYKKLCRPGVEHEGGLKPRVGGLYTLQILTFSTFSTCTQIRGIGYNFYDAIVRAPDGAVFISWC